ncbi:hypothetical protein Tsubulata_047462 [Turnera subulata]|uniref:Uncharacterized protein n=1 Tax=Turnera subulata TaxID=218843 RepID=A0A9Q0JHF8_9ROSI|nr:hypothetical protein Tsubulata_047462 [Turnera subulata]
MSGIFVGNSNRTTRRGRKCVYSTVSFLIDYLPLFMGLAAVLSWVYFNVRLGPWCRILHPNALVHLGFYLLGLWLLTYIVGSYSSDNQNLVCLLTSIMLVLIVLSFGLSVFILTLKFGEGKKIPGAAYKDYNPEDFPGWFQNYALPRAPTSGNRRWWLHYAPCLHDSQVCEKFERKYANQTAAEFFKNKFTPVEAGCCMPPAACGYAYNNSPTEWVRRPIFDDREFCRSWDPYSRPSRCYYCFTCIGAVLANVKMEWSQMAMTYFSILILAAARYIFRCINYRIHSS